MPLGATVVYHSALDSREAKLIELERPFYTIDEVSSMLTVTSGRVYQMISKGALPAVRIDGRIRIPRASWDTWLSNQSAGALANTEAEGYRGSPYRSKVPA